MNCPQARPLLPALAYGDLPPDGAAALRRHLADCPACRAAVEHAPTDSLVNRLRGAVADRVSSPHAATPSL